MATITEPRVKNVEGERRFVLHEVGWEGYQALLKMVGDRSTRLTYDGGSVELMSPLNIHERYKNRLGRVVEALTEELNIPVIGGGSTTLNREDLDKGLEPDECYYFNNRERIGWKRNLDMTVDPPPDLAIEIEITRSALNRLGIYAALGVAEVWRFDGETLSVMLLGPDGAYAESATSATFPYLPMDEVVRFLRDDEWDDSRWGRALRAWVREVVVPKAGDGGGGEVT